MANSQQVGEMLNVPVMRRRAIWAGMTSALRGVPIFPAAILALFIFFGLFGRLIVTYDPNVGALRDSLTPPFWQAGGSTKHLLGTDPLGRDMLSRIVVGASTSLQVGFFVVIICGFIGSVFALLSGYLGGWVDIVIMRLTDIVMSMPFLIVALNVAAIVGPGKYNLILILGLMGWAGYARILRGEVLRLKESYFVRLAIVAGCSKPRIMVRHIFPNIANTLVILATLNLGVIIIAEASLSFLGLGIPPPTPAWGSMISDGRSYLGLAWWVSTFPGIALFLVVLSSNLLGDWLRVRLDPKFRQL